MKGRIDHVGIVVAGLEPAAQFARQVLGLELKVQPPPAPNPIAFYGWEAGANVELIELVDPAARVARLGDAVARIDHIAVEVDDVDAAAAELQGHGVRFTTDAPVAVRDIRTLWTQADTSGGVMWQVFSRAT
ncbi:MAG TPA: VOC family protein [Candidatus Dormibacteraeota bacterium]